MIDQFNPFLAQFWIPVGTAFLCGAIIGVERQLRGKPAGIRTSILIVLSTMIFIQLGQPIMGNMGDPSRVLGQIVTGVGFLGGGVMLAREGMVYGVTTAAVIWILAAIGASIGLGHLQAAIGYALLSLFVLVGIDSLESSIPLMRRGIYSRLHQDRKATRAAARGGGRRDDDPTKDGTRTQRRRPT